MACLLRTTLASLLILPSFTTAHEDPIAKTLMIETPLATVGATEVLPQAGQAIPCVVIVGGTLSQDRDGRMFRNDVPKRDALKRLADALGAGGYASLRYDKVDFGSSKPKSGWTGTYTDEAKIVATLVSQLRSDKRFNKVIVAGESAGAYVACLAAKDGTQADAYLFLGAHCGPGEEIYAYNFGRLVTYLDEQKERALWANALKMELALGRHYKEMFAAASQGERSFELVDGGFRMTMLLARRREELNFPPDEIFRHIKSPALAIAGRNDRNVPPEHAKAAVKIMRQAGNNHAQFVLVDNADHNLQQVPADEHQQVRERFLFESVRRPYQPQAYREILRWLNQVAPTSAESDLADLDLIAGRTEDSPKPAVRGEHGAETYPKTDFTPERTYLAPGIEIVGNITDAGKTAGVDTLEGRIGPLILGDGSQAHFIDMPPGMFVAEHPHSTESIIYTVRGRWVLCSKGRRHVMKPGTLFRFGPNISTGYEVPFEESAFILIFKGDRITKTEQEFISYLRGMADKLKTEQKEGVPYLLKDLPEDHPARTFARQLK